MDPGTGGFVYEILIEGQLDANWADWFGVFEVVPQTSGVTTLLGHMPDQPALHGLLARLNNLGLVLISVRRINPEPDEIVRFSILKEGKND
jgi:hypothetical protein